MASANWHWRTLNLKDTFAQNWLSTELCKCSTKDLSVVAVQPLDGDCELGMRKSKLVTIYDLRVTAKWQGEREQPCRCAF